MNFKEFFSKQARKPSGLFGRWVMSRIFEKGNADLNGLMKELVSPEKDDHILEIGFGTGSLVRSMAANATQGLVEGIDFSRTMVALARKKNKCWLEKGRVKLEQGSFEQMTYPENQFDKICSANTIYFWPDPVKIIKKIFTILKPGGKLVIGFGDKEQLEKKDLSSDVFHLYSPDQVKEILNRGGFMHGVNIISDRGNSYHMHCAVAVK